MNKIPGDEDSVQGHNVRGVYWTKPDESGKEVMRDKPIDESKYTELISDFKNTYTPSCTGVVHAAATAATGCALTGKGYTVMVADDTASTIVVSTQYDDAATDVLSNTVSVE